MNKIWLPICSQRIDSTQNPLERKKGGVINEWSPNKCFEVQEGSDVVILGVMCVLVMLCDTHISDVQSTDVRQITDGIQHHWR